MIYEKTNFHTYLSYLKEEQLHPKTKKAHHDGELRWGNVAKGSERFAAQIVVQVLVALIVDRLVDGFVAIKTLDGLEGFLPGHIIVKETMDVGVWLQFLQALAKTDNGVEDDEVLFAINYDCLVLLLAERQVGQKIHEALEDADVRYHIAIMMDERDVLVEPASFIILVADFITVAVVAEADAEILFATQRIVYFPAHLLCNVKVYTAGPHIGQQRIVAQGHDLEVIHTVWGVLKRCFCRADVLAGRGTGLF